MKTSFVTDWPLCWVFALRNRVIKPTLTTRHLSSMMSNIKSLEDSMKVGLCPYANHVRMYADITS